MEIHTPERPPLSVKEFGIQLATITIGILIALSLEGVTQWFHHRSLVREARANLASELRDNKTELDKVLNTAPESEKQLRTALQFIDDLLAHRKSEIHTLSLSYNLALLNTASRSTAEATGALGYMDYAEVKRFATVYDLQQQFNRLQDRLIEAWIPMLTPAQTGDPDKLGERALLEWRQQVLTSLSHLQAEAGLGKSLSAAYDKALEKP
jgi:hypothetical protein